MILNDIRSDEIKIIHILNHSASLAKANLQSVVFDGWHAQMARAQAKYFRKLKCSFEVWTFDPCVKHQVFTLNGITYRIFNSYGIKPFIEYSYSLIKEALLLPRSTALFFLHGSRGLFSYSFIKWLGKSTIVQDHGTHANLLFGSIEKYLYKNLILYYALTRQKKDWLIYSLGLNPNKIRVSTMGVDFDKFYPMDKSHCKELIGVPRFQKTMLFVGRLNKIKGADKVLRAFSELKKKGIRLLIVGAHVEDPFFPIAKENGAIIYKRVDHSLMPIFYNASDVMVWLCPDAVAKFGGPGISVIEALACGTPCVSNTLIHIKESFKCGLIPNDPNQLTEHVLYIMNNTSEFKDCRDVAKRQYDWATIIKDVEMDCLKIIYP